MLLMSKEDNREIGEVVKKEGRITHAEKDVKCTDARKEIDMNT